MMIETKYDTKNGTHRKNYQKITVESIYIYIYTNINQPQKASDESATDIDIVVRT
jgi:hypothetical protein